MAALIFLGVPAHGHVNPSLPVVQALVERGHNLVYYNSEAFREAIEQTGAQFRPYAGPTASQDDIVRLLQGGNLASVTVLLLEMSVAVLPQLLDELQEDPPDLIIHDSIALWGYMVAKLLDMPSVASITHFILDGTALKPSFRETLHLIRLALPVLPRMLRLRGQLKKHYGPQIFQPGPLLPVRGDHSIVFTAAALQPQSTWVDDSFHFVGPSIKMDTRSASDFPFDWLSGAPLVYVSLGTIHHSNTAFFDMALEALSEFDGQVVMSIGKQASIEAFGPTPANMLLRHTVPQLEILQRCDVFITHGGMNSIHESLFYNVPMIVVPQQMEQLLNARVVIKQGAGIVLGGPFSPPVSAIELRAALKRIQTEPAFRIRAQALGESLRGAGGYVHAVDVIEGALR